MANFNPTIRQLKVFQAVAQASSFTRASEQLHLSQPAVSLQVKQLEDNVGMALFERIGKKVFLTEAGEAIYDCSKTISEILSDTDEIIDNLKGLRRGRLNIAVATTASYFVTRMLAEFAKTYPEITVSLDVTNRQSLLQQLERNERDLVIMGEPPKDRDLKSQAFMDNPLIVIAHPGHPCANRKKVPISELKNQHFVSRESGSGTRAAIQRFLNAKGVEFDFTMEMTSNEAIKQAVAAGLGLGIVSKHTVELELSSGKLVMLDIDAFPIMRHWYVVSRAGKTLSPIARLFQSYVLERGPALSNK
ncbi:MAG: LysR family transcriptional regulator [Chromatiales bacterium]|jgi:DNA-binding transcriptional LysR family regulator